MRLLEATDVVIRRNDRAIVQGASLQLRPGEMVGLIGPNGAGKSTLLRALLGLQPLSGGRCLLKGRDLRGWPPRERARELAYLPQNPQSHWPLRVDKVIELGRSPHLGLWRGLTPADRAAIERAVGLPAARIIPAARHGVWLDRLPVVRGETVLLGAAGRGLVLDLAGGTLAAAP